jgi:hypothetical protein
MMKKVLLAVGGMLLINAFLNAGFSSPKSSQTNSKPSNSSESSQKQFLTIPKTAPVLLPMPNQPKSSGSSSTAPSKKPSTPTANQTQTGSNTPANNSDPSASPQPQSSSTTTCSAGSSGTCTTPDTIDAPPNPVPGTQSCDLTDPNVPIEQFEQNGQIACQ